MKNTLKVNKAKEAMAASKEKEVAKVAIEKKVVVEKPKKASKPPAQKAPVLPVGEEDSSPLTSGRWTEEEKAMFKQGLARFGSGNWTKIKSLIPNRYELSYRRGGVHCVLYPSI